jgi:Protein of unknown function (DUF935)
MAPAAAVTAPAKDLSDSPEKQTEQLSYSGTPRYRERTRPDEYVTDLIEPVRRMEIFDEMRQSDEGINTALAAREQLIGSSTWSLTNPDNSDRGREILEFCEDNIYPVLPDLLRHLSGAMQYGFGAVEKVFAWSDTPFARYVVRGKIRRATNKKGGRMIRLRKLAHMRQRTIYTFVVPLAGDLTALRQYVWDGYKFQMVDVPAEKVLMWTYNRRGDDYWGVPPMRHAYKAWKFKMQIEKLNLLGLDRFGVGTPVAEEGPDWSEPERARLAAFLAAWRAGSNSFLMHPAGGKIEIVSGDGKMVIAALDWVKYYNIAIAKTFLTQMTELGSSETGSRALGETFYDQTQSVVQSDDEDIASIINEGLVVPLVDANYGPQDEYPLFVPSERVAMSRAVAQVIDGLIKCNAIKWSDTDEKWLRDKLDWPDIDLDQRAKDEKAKADLLAKQQQQALLPAPAPQLALPPGTPPEADPPAKARSGGALSLSMQVTAAEGAPDPAVPGETTHRSLEYSEWEMRILRPDILSRDLDVQSARLTGEVHDVLKEIDAELAADAARLAAKGPEAIAAGLRDVAVSGRLRNKLRKVMLAAAVRARAYGVNSVHTEIARQEAPEAIGPNRAPAVGSFSLGQWVRQFVADIAAAAVAQDPTPEERMRDLQLSAEVDRAVEDEIARREQSVRSNLIMAMTMAGTLSIAKLIDVVKVAVSQALESLSTGRTESNVQGVVNVGFGVGRSEAAAEIVARAKSSPGTRPDISPRSGDTGSGGTGTPGRVVGNIPELVAKIYSAVMDFGTCDECAKWDGARFPIDYPEDLTGVQAPNPRCYGGYSRCRCVWIYVTDREVGSITPSTKGPSPEYVPFSRSAA